MSAAQDQAASAAAAGTGGVLGGAIPSRENP